MKKGTTPFFCGLDREGELSTAVGRDLESVVERGLAAAGVSLWGLEWRRQDRRLVLCVYIDAPGGVTLDLCEAASRQLSALLDVEDVIQDRYVLEVSSPGIEPRLFTLDQCQRFRGSLVRLQTRLPIEGRAKGRGVLQAVEDGTLCVMVDGVPWHVPYEATQRIQVIANEEKDGHE